MTTAARRSKLLNPEPATSSSFAFHPTSSSSKNNSENTFEIPILSHLNIEDDRFVFKVEIYHDNRSQTIQTPEPPKPRLHLHSTPPLQVRRVMCSRPPNQHAKEDPTSAKLQKKT
ncbi:hypothetical protein CEXT_470731 [Caerostris extrusa]|uniref:Uncharacterized protein n=1 Tax=Caerostris extrusa TaxID=172846 RepID=A0AAV4W2A2_CAEEX|nr:hypothetical protein CEXT_470731 [Caerostris extrusa]